MEGGGKKIALSVCFGAGVWVVVGAAVVFATSLNVVEDLRNFLLFVGLALFDLWLLGMFGRATIDAVKTDRVFPSLAWGGAKTFFLGFVGLLLYMLEPIPAIPAILGVSALMAVPVLGGLIFHCLDRSKGTQQYA